MAGPAMCTPYDRLERVWDLVILDLKSLGRLSLTLQATTTQLLPLSLLFPVVITPSPECCLQFSLQGGCGDTMPAGPTFSGSPGSGCDLSRRRGGSLTGRQEACRWAHTRASCAAAGAQASCSNPSDSDQQDGPAQAEGSLQGGPLLQTEARAPAGRREAGRAAWAAELALFQRIQSRQ